MHKVGIDLGKSLVKTTCNGDVVLEFPPLLALAPESGRVASLWNGRGDIAEILWEGTRWLLGESVRGSWGSRWVTDERKVGTDAIVLALGALGRLGVQGDVTVCAGVPAALWTTDGVTLRRLLSGSFTFIWNGGERTVNAQGLVLPEPAGTYFSCLLGPNGRIADPDLARYPVAVVDIGFRSVDIVLVEDGAPRSHVTRSTAHGVVVAFERLYARLSGEVGLLADDERMDVFLSTVRGEPLVLKGRTLGVGLQEVVNTAKPEVAESIISDVRSALVGVNYRTVLWTGGGAEWIVHWRTS